MIVSVSSVVCLLGWREVGVQRNGSENKDTDHWKEQVCEIWSDQGKTNSQLDVFHPGRQSTAKGPIRAKQKSKAMLVITVFLNNQMRW